MSPGGPQRGGSARSVARDILREWRGGSQFADALLQNHLSLSTLAPADRAFVTTLVYGVLRNLSLLDLWIEMLRPAGLDLDTRDLVRLGLFQLLHLDIPPHAALFETVSLAPKRSRGVVNGMLRNAVRQRDRLVSAASQAPRPIRYSHPPFLLDRWSDRFGDDDCDALCRWNNTPAPLYARINLLRTSVDAFLSSHRDASSVAGFPRFVLCQQLPLEALARGDCYMQDPSTSIACDLLDPQPGESVLDACAAPGGKSGYIAELMRNTGELIACDRDPGRISVLAKNLAVLGASNARTLRWDWQNGPSAELRTVSFDRILVDVPCTNTGVMRRRVDVRWRLRPDDFERMSHEQLAIVRGVVPLLKPGGTLVYSTCSIDAEENERVADLLVREVPALRLDTTRISLPFRDGFDGAFTAKLIATK